MRAMNENNMFYEFSLECTSKAQDLCDKLKLRCHQSYNPYEWMFASEEKHFSGPDYETTLIQKYETENRMQVDERSTQTSSNDQDNCEVRAGNQEQSPQTLEQSISHDKLSRLGHIQASLHAYSVDSGTVADAIELINVTPLMQMHEVCEQLRLAELNESSLTVISEALIKHHVALSYTASSLVLQYLFKNKIVNLQQSASRVFSMTVTSTVKQFPQQMIEAVLIPAVQEHTFAVPQCEMMCKVAKEGLKPDHLILFLSQLLLLTGMWSEVFIPLMQMMIDLKVPMDQPMLTMVVKRYVAESHNLKSSLKFSKLLQSTVNKYGSHFTAEDIRLMRQALTENQTFLRKSVENLLKKLE